MSSMKQFVRRSLASAGMSTLLAPLTRDRVCIFTLHRFDTEHPTGMPGTPLDRLDQLVSRLRADGYALLSLSEAVRGLEGAAELPLRAVVFTVDDGYADLRRGCEIFERHACPLTVFLTTGFVDGSCWMWWDEVEYVCLHAPEGVHRPVESGPTVRFEADGPDARIGTTQKIWAHCKSLDENEKADFIGALIAATGVEVPDAPPAEYRPLSWDEVRDLEHRGVGFAPHTVTHPVLSRVSAEQAAFEIRASWERLQVELQRPVPVFAYPNGQPGDFGDREIRIARSAGLVAAVTTTPDYASRKRVETTASGRYELPRFPEPVDVVGACLAANGFQRLAGRLRGR